MNNLLTDNIWHIAGKTKRGGNTIAVVAYVTKDHLNLGRGDMLICDASDRTIAQGATSAQVLKRFLSAKVELFHLPSLHAKIIRLPSHVLLGSANMTVNTETLHEAAILTQDPEILEKADVFIRGLLARKDIKRITASEVNRLLAIPVVRPDLTHTIKANFEPDQNLWITRINPLSEKQANEVANELGTRINHGERYDGAFVVFGPEEKWASQVKIDDRIILIDTELVVTGPHEVTGVHRIVKVTNMKRVPQIVVTYSARRGRGRVWSNIQSVLKATGAWSHRGRPSLMMLTGEAHDKVLTLLLAKKKLY